MSRSRAAIRERLDSTAAEEAERWLAYRVRIVPQQLDAARRKVAALENEARRLGMTDLLQTKEAQQ